MKALNDQRYSRQVLIPEIGEDGQQKLRRAKVLIVGLGGLGSPAALYLAGAGVGKLGLLDPDKISLHNLHRQILYRTRDVGKKKAYCAAERIVELNGDTVLEARDERLTANNVREWVEGYDLILDGTDQFGSRYLLHDTCFELRKPYLYGAIHQFEGQISLFNRDHTPCYRCLYPSPPEWVPNCAEAGVLGVLPGIIGMLQATEALKLILGIGESLAGRLLIYNALNTSISEFRFLKNPACPLCGTGAAIKQSTPQGQSLSPVEFAQFVRENPNCQIVDVRESGELAHGTLPGHLHIPLGELAEKMHARLKLDHPVLVYCQRGSRSRAAGALLRKNGFATVCHLEGGYEAAQS